MCVAALFSSLSCIETDERAICRTDLQTIGECERDEVVQITEKVSSSVWIHIT